MQHIRVRAMLNNERIVPRYATPCPALRAVESIVRWRTWTRARRKKLCENVCLVVEPVEEFAKNVECARHTRSVRFQKTVRYPRQNVFELRVNGNRGEA